MVQQVTLVSFYREKPLSLQTFLENCQNLILDQVGDLYIPYQLDQIHGTVIGLEGCSKNSQIINTHFADRYGVHQEVKLEVLLSHLRGTSHLPFHLQFGGYHAEYNEFFSRGCTPYERSFTIQGDTIVLMGWDTRAQKGAQILDDFRRSFNTLNILHKWHRQESDVDDDFYMVLGHMPHANPSVKANLTKRMQQFLSKAKHTLRINMDASWLSLVNYKDTTLPLNLSTSIQLHDPRLTAAYLKHCYEPC